MTDSSRSPWSLQDVDALREKLRALAAQGKFDDAIDALLELLVSVRDDNTALRVRLHNAIRQLYGNKSEKVSLDQLLLAFDRIEHYGKPPGWKGPDAILDFPPDCCFERDSRNCAILSGGSE